MVVISSELSDGSVIRSRNENGSCSMNGPSDHPVKWKPRNVCAVRDFPPGCGPVLRVINADAHESEPLSLPVTDSHEVNGTGVDEQVAVTDNHEVNDAGINEQVATDNHVANETGTDEQVGLIGENLVNNGLKNGDTQVDNGVSVIKEAIPKIKFARRRISAIRDFPPYCGLNAEEPTEEERIRINGKRSHGTELDQSVKHGSVLKTQLQEPSVANEERQTTVESNKDVEDGKNGKVELSKKVQNIGQACQELVVYTRDKVLKKPSPVDDVRDYEDDSLDHKSLSLIQIDYRKMKNQELASKKPIKKRPLDDNDGEKIKKRPLDDTDGEKVKVVIGLRAPLYRVPGVQEKDFTPNKSVVKKEKDQEKVVGESSSPTDKGKMVDSMIPKKPMKKKPKKLGYRDGVMKTNLSPIPEEKEVDADDNLEVVVKNEGDDAADMELNNVAVALPPYGPTSSNDARDKVRQTLRLFQALSRKILQGEEAKTDDIKLPKRRVDLGAKTIMDHKGWTPVLGKKTYGPVPGVEVGDEFQYRVELALVGIHRPFQSGIDFVKEGKEFFAVSVVASGGYDNDIDKPDCLMYSGSGGVGKDKSFENQKLERGNLALKNNVDLRYPVRVVRGYKVKSAEPSDSKSKMSTTYIYDGLYTVETCLNVPGPKGNMVYKFELKRVPGQPLLAIREVSSKKFKTREGVCVKDIADGKEPFPICAINTIDDQKPPPFTYITKIMYPDWYKPIPPKGCNCVGRCSDKRCSCASLNGGEIPYNRNGAIVEAKPLVYECGPSCRCSPSCYNRVTQKGMKIHLEIFKTEKRGWGVRSLSSISSGSFICEYVGELLEDTEAEKRTGNDEYLFDIGANYNDCSHDPHSTDSKDSKPEEIVNEGGGFTIDAANYGNVGRFINHSCAPNLYAQNVLYDQDDKRMPHIMLFAAENIPPLQELTYHYNYMVDTVHDADGNIKVKNCFCGSSECSGRLY